jgi:hypothetical protein
MDKCQLKVYQSRFWRSFVQKWFNFFKNQSKGTALRSPFHSESEKHKCSWYSGMQHSQIHITHFFFPKSRCGLGKGMRCTPFCSLSGDRLSVLHVPQAHRLTMFIYFFHKQLKSIQLLYYTSSLLF